MRRAPVITLMAIAGLIALPAALAPAREGAERDAALSATGDARVAVALDGTGALAEAASGAMRLGLRWPGAGGTEFLGSGQFVMRCQVDGRGAPEVLTQRALEPALSGDGVVRLGEDCAGGRRGPGAGGDDDGDGAVDEDPFDGIDNDGDGRVDEDFAAAGHDMLVTRAVSRRVGLAVTQHCYHWEFGHVRDFLGFTTRIAYEPTRSRKRPLRLFEAALVTDFRIGDPDDQRRGGNDRHSHVAAAAKDAQERPLYSLSLAADPRGPAAAVVIFSVRGPDGEPLATDASIIPSAAAADSLWGAGPSGASVAVLGADGGREELAAQTEHLSGRQFATPPVIGEQAFVHRFGGGVDLNPGDFIVVEWAIVFGRDLPGVMRAAARARETWEGMSIPGGGERRWVVPARTARRIETDASISPAWVLGERRAAATLLLPPGFDEDVEWLAVSGAGADGWEIVSGRIVTIVEQALVDAGAPFSVEAQMTDGTILAGRVGAGDLARYRATGELAPERLPEESMRLFPNPFVSSLMIGLVVGDSSLSAGAVAARSGTGSVRIYDVKGRLVRSILEREHLSPGEYSVSWDGNDETGARVAPGVYYCKFQVGERSLTKRVILLR
ncbi:MAG: FlgD immunoglobulin-like domain containing protein [Candidatus Krumholzibacteria bacterium]|nr:FlgD immunoglobulin-like domain containing protein [Candidatus Krumholzibacteria bacterium]